MNTCNFYWSNTPMPWIRYLTLATFRKLNPTWGINLYTSDVTKEEQWTGQPQDAANYYGEDYRNELNKLNINIIEFNKYPNLSSIHMADMCRWNVLAAGGVFADMDIIFMNPMIGFEFEFDGISHNGQFFRIGLISGEKNGVFEDALIYAEQKIKFNLTNNDYQTLGVRVLYEILNCSSKDAWKELIDRGNNNIVKIPMDWVHPLGPEQILNNKPPSWVIGNHWYAGHPPHRWHVDNLNENTIEQYRFIDRLTEGCFSAKKLIDSL